MTAMTPYGTCSMYDLLPSIMHMRDIGPWSTFSVNLNLLSRDSQYFAMAVQLRISVL